MTVLVLFLIPCVLSAAENLPVNLVYPPFDGDFYASGNLSFAPGAVPTEDHIVVNTKDTREEVPTKIAVSQRWPDGSVLNVDITFAVNRSRPGTYLVVFGGDVLRKKKFAEAAVLPVVAFSTAGAPRAAENVDMDVGQINVRVDKSPGIRYYRHLLPIAALIVLAWYRSRRANKKVVIASEARQSRF